MPRYFCWIRIWERSRQRRAAVAEQLAGAFQALVINFGSWFPDLAPSLVAIAPAALGQLRAKDRASVIADLQVRTRRAGGMSYCLPRTPAAASFRSAPRRSKRCIRDGRCSAAARSKRSGFTAIKPPRQVDTAGTLSE